MKPIGVFVLAILLASFAHSAEEPLSEENLFPPSYEELMNNMTQIFAIENETLGLAPYFNNDVVESDSILSAEIPLSISAREITTFQCIGPTIGQKCECQPNINKNRPDEMYCEFRPPVSGYYYIYIESKTRNAYGNFTINLEKGKPPVVIMPERGGISTELVRFALIFAFLTVFSYVAYFAYKFAMRKRDAMNRLYDARQKTEDDMKVLRYRFFKREIDANTYNTVFKQKEQELAVINGRILKSLKSREKKKPEGTPQPEKNQ
ncbi:MAG: hypothetical protein ABIG96_05570 [Candidatus Micrarchaeota archaeon]